MKNLAAFFEIPAVDFGRAVKFYEEIFGCTLSVMENASEKMAYFPEQSGKCPGAVSFAPDFNPSKDGVLLSLYVNNLDETSLRIQTNGGKIITPKTKIDGQGMGFFAVFLDSEGNRLGIYSEQ